jgi:hypothetical protein
MPWKKQYRLYIHGVSPYLALKVSKVGEQLLAVLIDMDIVRQTIKKVLAQNYRMKNKL